MVKIRNIYQNLLLIAGSILVVLILLELGLRIGGSIFILLQDYKNSDGLKDSQTYKILCLGESSTALGGKYSYPNQLEKILNEKKLNVKFKIINKGIPGVTSSYILSKLDGYLIQHKPDMVVVMMGINDFADDREEFRESFDVKLKDFFSDMRVYKLFKLLKLSIVKKLKMEESKKFTKKQEFMYKRILEDVSEEFGPFYEAGWGLMAEEKFVEAEKLFRKAWQDFPDDVNAYINLALCLNIAGNVVEAETILKQGLVKFPANSNLPYTLGQIYIFHKRWKEAIDVFVQAKSLEPGNNDINMALGWCYLKNGESLKAENLYKNSSSFYKSHDFYKAMKLYYEIQNDQPLADRYLKESQKAKVGTHNPITKFNYNILKEKVLKSGVKLVCVQYPRREVRILKKLLNNDKNITFIDNESIFDAAVKSEGYDTMFINNFAGDFGHCTPEGNRLLAQNIAEAILNGLNFD